jgi:DNA/RNA endonuclease G (NUC1)
MSAERTPLSSAPWLALALLAFGLGDAARAQGDATDPENCREFWEAIGLPATRKDFRCDETACDFVTVCHDGYITLHNNVTKTPDWVIQHMTAAQVSGDHERPDVDFKPEQHAPEDRRAIDDDYKNSGLARGHQAASADYSMDPALMEDTFFFSNAVPQVGNGFNSGIWSALEALVRDLARERGEIFVITGPIYQDPGGQERIRKTTRVGTKSGCRRSPRHPSAMPTTMMATRAARTGSRCRPPSTRSSTIPATSG